MRKNIWKWGLFILLLAPVMTACKDDDEDDYNFQNDPHHPNGRKPLSGEHKSWKSNVPTKDMKYKCG